MPVKAVVAPYRTHFEFEISVPYSLESEAAGLSIEMKQIELPTEYIYKVVPKLNNQVFLTANIIEWEQKGLLDGEVNLYFENTFVGTSLLNLSQMSDTLAVSLGPDKSISVQREKQKNYADKQFLGGNKFETRVWTTTVRNNKSKKIQLLMYDQVPISENEDIEIEVKKLSNGKLNEETGVVLWELTIPAGKVVEKTIEYKVKYPKKRKLIVD